MKKITHILLLLTIGLVISAEFKPISQKPFDLEESGIVYGRGIYMIVLPSQASETYLTMATGGDFIKFKKTQGYDVEIVYLDEIEHEGDNPEATDLKSHIVDFKSNNPMLEYVLLVGDVNGPYTIPTFTINSYNEDDVNVTDYPYTFIDDSYKAEFFIGRWPVRSAGDLLNIKSRTIQYITNEYLESSQDVDIYDRALIVAGNYKTAEGVEVPPNEWPVTPVWTSLWLYDELDEYGYSQIDTAFFHQGNYLTGEFNPLIEQVWNEGVGVINYRGWGDANGWHKPYFHRAEVEALSNGYKLPIVLSFVCNTGDFGNDYSGGGLPKCFGEVLVTAGSITLPKGATAVVGPSDLDTDTRFNNVICGVMWDGILEKETPELAQALHKGKQSLITEFWVEEEDSGLEAEDGTVIDEFYHHVYGVLGDPSLPVTLEEPKEIIHGQDGNPNEIYQTYVLMNLTNVDLEPIVGVVGALLDESDNLIGKGTSDVNGDLFVEFDENLIGNNSSLSLYLNKAQYKQVEVPFLFVQNNDDPSNYNTPIHLGSSLVDSENKYLVPGSALEFYIEYSNLSNEDLSDVTVNISSNDVVVNQNDNVFSLGPFNSGSLSFNVSVSSDMEIGSHVTIISELSKDGYVLTADDLKMIVSDDNVSYSITNPTPPCEYGYWAYDIGDENYSTQVEYSWEEINSSGTNIGLTDDTIETIQLPFDFKYYGNIYSEGSPLTVCSNGWVAFEPTQIDYFWNFSIPNPLGPSAMVAPFMDDLDDNGGTVPFNVYYKEYNDRFIIEWDHVLNGEDDQNCPDCIDETFQVIFYNEEYHPTETDDGEIKFQYKEIYDIDANGNYSTIGVESPNQNVGLQYLFSKNKADGSGWDQDLDGIVEEFAVIITTNSPSYIPDNTVCDGNLLNDVNQDGNVNVVDIVNLVNIIFGLLQPNDVQSCVGDANQDGTLNVVDIVNIVNYIFES